MLEIARRPPCAALCQPSGQIEIQQPTIRLFGFFDFFKDMFVVSLDLAYGGSFRESKHSIVILSYVKFTVNIQMIIYAIIEPRWRDFWLA